MAYDRCESLQGSSSRRRSKGRQSGYEPYKRGLNTKIHLAVDSSGMPVRAIITEGTRADCKEAIHLIEGIDAQNLLADRGYDTSEIVAFALSAGRWRGLATRYANNTSSFLSAVHIRCIAIWLAVLA